MAHIHEVKDTETRFIINATTREISNADELPALVQGDHNSERFTFSVNRFVDGHDLLTCNKVKVHYLNIESVTRKPYADVYEIDDLNIDETDETKVVCTWLVSKYATQYVGLLNFAIHFVCENNGVIDYAWKTAIFKGIVVKESVDSTEQIMTEYTDILEKWKQDIVKELTESGAGLNEEQEADLAANTEARHTHSNKSLLDNFKVISYTDPFYNGTDANDLKYGDASLRKADEGAVIKRITPIEKNGKKFLRLTLNWGNEPMFEPHDDVVDIPVEEVKSFIEQSGNITLNGSELNLGLGGTGSGGIKPVTALPEIATEGDVVYYCPPANTLTSADSNKEIYLNFAEFERLKTESELLDFSIQYNNEANNAPIINMRAGGGVKTFAYSNLPKNKEYWLLWEMNYQTQEYEFSTSGSYVRNGENFSYLTKPFDYFIIDEIIDSNITVNDVGAIVGSNLTWQSYALFYTEPRFYRFTNGKWVEILSPQATVNTDDIWAAINEIRGGIDEIEAMIDESGVLE